MTRTHQTSRTSSALYRCMLTQPCSFFSAPAFDKLSDSIMWSKKRHMKFNSILLQCQFFSCWSFVSPNHLWFGCRAIRKSWFKADFQLSDPLFYVFLAPQSICLSSPPSLPVIFRTSLFALLFTMVGRECSDHKFPVRTTNDQVWYPIRFSHILPLCAWRVSDSLATDFLLFFNV